MPSPNLPKQHHYYTDIYSLLKKVRGATSMGTYIESFYVAITDGDDVYMIYMRDFYNSAYKISAISNIVYEFIAKDNGNMYIPSHELLNALFVFSNSKEFERLLKMEVFI